jgi:hypothetical protein
MTCVFSHVNLPFHIHVGELKKNEVVIKMKIIKLGNEVVVSKVVLGNVFGIVQGGPYMINSKKLPIYPIAHSSKKLSLE